MKRKGAAKKRKKALHPEPARPSTPPSGARDEGAESKDAVKPFQLVREAGNSEVGLADAERSRLDPWGAHLAEVLREQLALLGGFQQLLAFARNARRFCQRAQELGLVVKLLGSVQGSLLACLRAAPCLAFMPLPGRKCGGHPGHKSMTILGIGRARPQACGGAGAVKPAISAMPSSVSMRAMVLTPSSKPSAPKVLCSISSHFSPQSV